MPKARPAALNALSSLSLSLSPVRSHVLTSGTHEAMAMQRPDLNGPPPKIFSRSFAKKPFLKKTKEGGMGHDVTSRGLYVTNRGGVRGHSPPSFSRTTGTYKSPSEAVFIVAIFLSLFSVFILSGGCGPRRWPDLS